MIGIPKVIPPRSRVRLIKTGRQTPDWRKDLGRQFRVGYYNPKDGLECIWLVNENAEYEQTTDRKSLLKYFAIESLSHEKDFYGRKKRRLGKIPIRSVLTALQHGSSSLHAYEAAKAIGWREDRRSVKSLIETMQHGTRVLNRAAAAYGLSMLGDPRAVPALERVVNNQREHPRVRGQAAEALAHCHRRKSHQVLLNNLAEAPREVRFWCAYSLAEMSEPAALEPLRKLAEEDQRIVRGFWPVSKEAKWAIRRIRAAGKTRKLHHRLCIFCSPARRRRT